MTKNCSPGTNQIKKCPKTVSCKECTYVQKDKNGKDEKIDSPADTEQTFFSSYFIDKPNYTVESIEVRLDEINMERLQNKGEKVTSQEQDEKNVRIDEEKEAACPDGTPPDDMEEGVGEK